MMIYYAIKNIAGLFYSQSTVLMDFLHSQSIKLLGLLHSQPTVPLLVTLACYTANNTILVDLLQNV